MDFDEDWMWFKWLVAHLGWNFLDLDTMFLTIFGLIKKVNKKPREVIKLKNKNKMVKWKIKW